jgi:DNA-binding XRE family transcriptional regulator
VTSREMPSSAQTPWSDTVRPALDDRLSFAESEFLKQLGDQLRALRLRRNLLRRVLAQRSRISERYIARIETGKGNVSIVLLFRLAHALRSEEAPKADAITGTGGLHWERLL